MALVGPGMALLGPGRALVFRPQTVGQEEEVEAGGRSQQSGAGGPDG